MRTRVLLLTLVALLSGCREQQPECKCLGDAGFSPPDSGVDAN